MAAVREREVAYLPRLLLFVRDDVVDDEVIGYRHVAVGLRWHDGTCVSVQDGAPGGPPSVTSWIDVAAAVDGMDAFVCEFNPARDLGRAHERMGQLVPGSLEGLSDVVGRIEHVSADLRAVYAELVGAVSTVGVLADLRQRQGGTPDPSAPTEPAP